MPQVRVIEMQMSDTFTNGTEAPGSDREMRALEKFQRMAKFYKEMKLLAVQKDNDILSTDENH